MLTAEGIPHRSIPGHTELFLKYRERDPVALGFYGAAPDLDELERRGRRTSQQQEFPRRELAGILSRQNQTFGCGAPTLEMLTSLAEVDSVAVVTGQQLGLFTGPLYTIYKALTAIRVAAELRTRGLRAVPVFWMDSDDHDLAEALHVTAMRPGGNIERPDYRVRLFGSEATPAAAVGDIQLPGSIAHCVTDYCDTFSGWPWSDEYRRRIEESYSPGNTFAQAFGLALTGLLGHHGLILLNPADREFKRLAVPFFENAVAGAKWINAELRKRADELVRAGFHVQVAVSETATGLFLHAEGRRAALIRSEDRFAIRNGSDLWGVAELRDLVRSEPWRFSPNVLLRPVLQDHLLPTTAYVGGPSEIAYFSQAEVVYRHFERVMPLIWMRAGFTLLDREVVEAMERLSIGFEEVLSVEDLLGKIVPRMAERSDTTETIRELREDLTRELEQSRALAATLEPTLGHAFDTAYRKVRFNLDRLLHRSMRLDGERDSSLRDRARLITGACRPHGNLQERELGVFPYLARYGPGLLDSLYSLINPAAPEHLLIRPAG